MKRAKMERDATEIVVLNVGGTKMQTHLSLLRDRYPQSKFAYLFADNRRDGLEKDDEGDYFIDSDPVIMAHLLQYMRRGLPFDEVPPSVSPLVWQKEVECWQLPLPMIVKELPSFHNLMTKRIEDAQKTLEETILLLFELQPIHALDQSRPSLSFLIPYDEYRTKWGEDLYAYLLAAQHVIQQTFTIENVQRYRIWGGKITIVRHTITKRIDYQFNGRSYNTMDKNALQIEFEREKV